MATLYYAENVHIAQTLIPTPYFYIAQESESESVPVSKSGNVIKPLASSSNYKGASPKRDELLSKSQRSYLTLNFPNLKPIGLLLINQDGRVCL